MLGYCRQTFCLPHHCSVKGRDLKKEKGLFFRAIFTVCRDLYGKELPACSDMIILMGYFVNSLCCFYSVSYWMSVTSAARQ